MDQYIPPQPVQIVPPTPYKRPIRKNANIIGFSLLVVNLLPILLDRLMDATRGFWWVFMEQNYDLFEQIVEISYYTIPFTVAIVLSVVLLRIPLGVAFPMRCPKMDVLLCSIGIAMGGMFLGQLLTGYLGMLLEYVTQHTPTAPEMVAPRGALENTLYFISIAILPAILEEALFRGVLLQSLRRFGDSFALICSSILFGVLHGNFIQMPYTLFLGLILGYFVLYTGSLWPGIIIHFVNNGSSVILEWMTLSTTAEQDDRIYNIYLMIRISVALIGLIILRYRLGSLFYIPPSRYPLQEKEKYSSFFSTGGILLFLALSAYIFSFYLEPYVAEGVARWIR